MSNANRTALTAASAMRYSLSLGSVAAAIGAGVAFGAVAALGGALVGVGMGAGAGVVLSARRSGKSFYITLVLDYCPPYLA